MDDVQRYYLSTSMSWGILLGFLAFLSLVWDLLTGQSLDFVIDKWWLVPVLFLVVSGGMFIYNYGMWYLTRGMKK